MKKTAISKARLASFICVGLLSASSTGLAQTGVYEGVGTTTAVPISENILAINSDDSKSGLFAASNGSATGVVTSNHGLTINNSFNHDTSVARNNYGTAMYAYDADNSKPATIAVTGDVAYTADTNAYADVTARGANSSITVNGKLTGSTNSRLSAIYATGGGKISASAAEITTNSTTPIYGNTWTNQTQGVIADKGSQVTITGNLNLINNGMLNNRGIYAGAGSTIHLGSYTADVNREGIYARNRSIISFSSGTTSRIIIDGAAVVKARDGFAVSADDTSTIKMGSVDVTQTEKSNGSNKNSAISATGSGAQIDVTGLAKVNISNSWGSGLYASTGGVINAGSTDITVGAKSANGIYAAKGTSSGTVYRGQINIAGNAKVVTESDWSGIMADSATVTAGSADITSNGVNGKGIHAMDSEGKVDIAGLAKVTMTKDDGVGVFAEYDGVVNLGSADITTAGIYGDGIIASSDSYNGVRHIGTVNVSGDTKVTTSGEKAHGIYTNGGDIFLKDAVVTTTGTDARGISISSKGKLVGSNVQINTSGNGGIGAYLVDGAAQGATLSLDSLNINTAGSIGKPISTSVPGNAAYGLLASGNHIQVDIANRLAIATNGDNASALAVKGTSVINAGSVGIVTNGAAAHGIRNEDGGTVTVANGGTIMVNGADSYGINTLGADPAAISTVNLTGVTTSAPSSNIAVYGNGNGLVNGMGITLNGDIVEDQDSGTDGILNVNLQSASILNGATHLKAPSSSLNLSLKENSIWNMTGDSDMTGLENTNSLVDMHSANPGYSHLVTTNYAGTGGTFKMDTDLASETDGDKVTITSASPGTTKVQVYDASLTNGKEVTGVKNLLLITDSSKTATFVGQSLNAGGLWDVTPELKKGTEALDANGLAVGTDDQWYLTKVAKKANPDTKVLLWDGFNSYTSWRWRNTDDTLRQRLGDLRLNSNTKDADGVWARYRYGRYNGSGLDGSYGLFQVGYDKFVHEGNVIGVAYETGAGRSSYDNGYTKETIHDFSLYGTWYGKNGSYTDVLGSYGTISNNTESYGEYPDAADSHGKAYRLSIEHGRTIDLDQQGAFIEPQAQLIFGRLGGRNYSTNRQTQVDIDATNSVIGRLGFVLGRKTSDKNDVYFKASILHEFAGKQDMDLAAANGETMHYSQDYGGTWYVLGLGGNWDLSKACHLYADVERTFGADANKTVQFNAGLRWEF